MRKQMDVEMEQREARQKYTEGAFVLAMGVPPGAEFGVDMMVYTTADKFKGLKMVPPGLHLVHFGTGMGEKQGFFCYLKRGDVLMRTWDNHAEELVEATGHLDGSVETALLSRELDECLGPYPYEQLSTWINLSNAITVRSLERAGVRVGGNISPGECEQSADIALLDKRLAQQHKAYQEARAHRGGISHQQFDPVPPKCVPRFTDVDPHHNDAELRRRTRDETVDTKSVLTELSKFHYDTSTLLQQLIDTVYEGKWADVIAELQLAFLLFMNLYSFPALNQWKALVNMLCTAQTAPTRYPQLYTAFIRAFQEQLNVVPSDFFENEISTGNFLSPALSSLFQILDDTSLDPTLAESANRLLKYVRRKFGVFHNTTRKRVDNKGNDGDGDVDYLTMQMQMNLVEEDMPVIVPYEDVERAVDGEPQQHQYPSSQDESPFQEDELQETVVEVHKSGSALEASAFGWRYPALYDFNAHAPHEEDLEMTAVRLIDEIPENVSQQREEAKKDLEDAEREGFSTADVQERFEAMVRLRFLSKAREEAVRYLQDDISKRTHIDSAA